jgi:hypothetical protein
VLQAVFAVVAGVQPAAVPEDAELAVQDGTDVPVRKQKSKYFLPTTEGLCVSFLIAQWAAEFFPCYLIL